MKIMAVVAHPDDEVLGCGGTLARYADEGAEVYVQILGEGAMARPGGRKNQVRYLRDCAVKARKILGLHSCIFESLPDNRFDTVALLDIIQIVEPVIRKLQPEIIFTHDYSDLNIDHRLTHDAVLTATRPMTCPFVKELLAFEVPSATEWRFEPAFAPNYFVDITRHLERKLDAFRCYDTELRDFPHPRSAEMITALAKRNGSVAGYPAAEAFRLMRKI